MCTANISRLIMKILLIILAISGLWLPAYSQDTLVIGKVGIKLTGGVPLFINGSLVNNDSMVNNSGNIYIKGNIINNNNGGLFGKNDEGKVYFIGDTVQRVTGLYPVRFNKIVLNKKDSSLMLGVDILMSDSVVFVKGNIDLNGKYLYLDNSALNFAGILDIEKDSSRIISDSGYVWTEMPLHSFIDLNGLGLGIQLSDYAGGDIKIERGHTSEVTVTDGSIKKYYNLYPENQLNSEVIVYYIDSADFIGVNGNEADFKLWTSATNGYYYENKYGKADTAGNFVTSDGIISIVNPTRITVSDEICDNPPKVDLGADTIHICKGGSKELNAGNTGYDFLWSTGATTQKITVKNSGRYSVVVTDPLGCFTLDSVFVVVDSLPHTAFSTLSGVNYICENGSIVFVNSSNIDTSGAPLSYLWEFGDGSVSNEESPAKQYKAAGSYMVSLTAYSAPGCYTKAQKQVIVNSLPVVNFDFGDECQLKEIVFTNSSSGVITGNLWDFGNGDTSSLVSPVYNYPDSGRYNVTLTVTNNFGCTGSLTKPISIFAPGKAGFTTEDAEVCIGNPSVFHNTSMIESGSMTYKWDFGNGLRSEEANPVISYDIPGSYEVTLVAATAHGCNDTIRKTVTVHPLPVSDFTFTDVCYGNTVHFTSTSTISPKDTLSYEWMLGDGSSATGANIQKLYGTSGTYKAKLKTVSSKACAASVEKSVNIYPNPVASFSAAPVCLGSDSEFRNLSDSEDGPLVYNWDLGDGNTTNDSDPVHRYAGDGSYNAALIATTVHGCADTVFGNVTVHSLPVVDIGDSIFHCGNTYMLNAGNSAIAWLWSTNETTSTIQVTRSGNYSVTVTSAEGCSNSDNVKVILNTPVQVNLGEAVINACDSVTLDAGYPGASYLWSTGETSRKIKVVGSGNYSVTVNNQGCTGNGEVQVNMHVSPVFDLGPDIIACEGEVITVDAGIDAENYLWSTGATSNTLIVTTPGNYILTVTDTYGCQGTDKINVRFNPLPVRPFSGDITGCGETVLDALNPGAVYLWNEGSVSRTITAANSGTYSVKITSADNCSLTDSIHVTVNPFPEIFIGNDTAICMGERLTLDAGNEGSGYIWSTGHTSQTIEVTSSGNYKVTVTNIYNCSSTGFVDVTINQLPLVDLGADLYICKNQVAILDAGNAGQSYQWISSTGFTSDQRRVFVSDSGKYSVEVTNIHGCKSSDSVLIQHSALSLDAYFLSPSFAVTGDSVMFVDVSYPEPDKYFWDFGDGSTDASEMPVHIYNDAGVYRVRLTVLNSFCSDTISKPITIEESFNSRLGREEGNDQNVLFEIREAKLYPNPTDGRFMFELQLNMPEKVILSLFELNGVLIYNEIIDSESYVLKSYEFSKLPPGVYIFKMAARDQIKTYRIVKH